MNSVYKTMFRRAIRGNENFKNTWVSLLDGIEYPRVTCPVFIAEKAIIPRKEIVKGIHL